MRSFGTKRNMLTSLVFFNRSFLLSSNVFKPFEFPQMFWNVFKSFNVFKFLPKSLNLTQNVRCHLTEKRRWTLWAWIHPSSTSSSSWGNPRSSRTRLWHSGVDGPREGSGWRVASGSRPAVDHTIMLYVPFIQIRNVGKIILLAILNPL